MNITLEPSRHEPLRDFCLDGEHLSWIMPKAIFEGVRIHFQWDRLIAAAAQKSADIELRKAHDSKLPILFDMDQFMKEQSIGERLVRDNYIAERDCPHGALVGKIFEPQ